MQRYSSRHFPLLIFVLCLFITPLLQGVPARAQGTTGPVITSLSPPWGVVGATDVTLQIIGSGFLPGAVVSFDGTPLTTVVSSGSLATVHTGALAHPRKYTVQLTNVPGSGTGAPSYIVLWTVYPQPNEVWVDQNYSAAGAGGHLWQYDAFAVVQQGLNAVAAGGTVNVDAGTYHESLQITGKVLTLQGAGAAVTDVDGNGGLDRCLAIGDVNGDGIQDLTFSNGSADNGGAVLVSSASVTFQSCVFSSSTATNAGGGIALTTDSDASFTDCVISDCHAATGGGIYQGLPPSSATTKRPGRPTFGNITITRCSAISNGGGCAIVNATAAFSSCTMTDNQAGNGGGLSITGSSSVTWDGGDVNGDGVPDATVSGNGNGGGLYTAGGATAALSSVNFTDCSAAAAGGGVSADASTLTLTNCTMTNNQAGNGGGLSVTDSSSVTWDGGDVNGDGVPDATVSGNGNGGGIYIDGGSTATLSGLSFSDCSAAAAGGGISMSDDSQATLTTCTISDCSATTGGGFAQGVATGHYLRKKLPGKMKSGTLVITRCTATGNGGGCEIDHCSATFSSCSMSNNQAGNGGGMSITDGSSVTWSIGDINGDGVPDNIVPGNGNGGGIYMTGGSTATLGSVSFTDCSAAATGGGVSADASTLNFTDCTMSQTSAPNGGGCCLTGGASLTWAGGFMDGDPDRPIIVGALYNGESQVSLSNVDVTDWTAIGNGGGIYALGGTVSCSGGAISDCTAANGGGIYGEGSSTVALTNMTLSGNSATGGAGGAGGAGGGNGGACAFDASTGTMTGCTVSNNTACNGGACSLTSSSSLQWTTGDCNDNAALADSTGGGGAGGAFYVSGQSSLACLTVRVQRCSAVANGGGIYADGGIVRCSDGSCSSCFAGNGGGFAMSAGASLLLSNETCSICRARGTVRGINQGQGGACYLDASTGDISNSTMSNNVATTGGCIYCGTTSHLRMTNVTVQGNQAVPSDPTVTPDLCLGGGILVTDSADATLTGCQLTGNSATTGGGLDAYVSPNTGKAMDSVALTNCQITNNTAVNGGGACLTGGPVATFTTVTFDSNTSSGDGAGVCDDGPYAIAIGLIIIKSCAFTNNQAGGNGGACAIDNGAYLHLPGVSFAGNTAKGNGGHLYIAGGRSISVADHCDFRGGQAAESGGAAYVGAGASLSLDNCLLTTNSAPTCGGVLLDGGSLTCTSSTVSANSGSGIGESSLGGSQTLLDSIFWGNGGDNFTGATMNYCCAENPLYQDNGNEGTNPLFESDNAHLQAYSPCVNAGDPSVTSPPAPATDLDGNPRIMFGRIDMGCYEVQVALPNPKITNISPSSAIAGSSGFTLTVRGTNFTPASVVYWGTIQLPTTVVSSTLATCSVDSSLLKTPGTVVLLVSLNSVAPPVQDKKAVTFSVTPAPQVLTLTIQVSPPSPQPVNKHLTLSATATTNVPTTLEYLWELATVTSGTTLTYVVQRDWATDDRGPFTVTFGTPGTYSWRVSARPVGSTAFLSATTDIQVLPGK